MFYVSSFRHPLFQVKSIDFDTNTFTKAEIKDNSTATNGLLNRFGATSLLLVEDHVFVGGNAKYMAGSNDFYPMFVRFDHTFHLLDVFLVESEMEAYSIDVLALSN